MQKIADKVFLLTPRNVEISAGGARAPARKGLLQPVLTGEIRRGERGPHRRGQHGGRACARLGGRDRRRSVPSSTPSAPRRSPTSWAARRWDPTASRGRAPTSWSCATSRPQLEEVAERDRVGSRAQAVVSILGGVRLRAIERPTRVCRCPASSPTRLLPWSAGVLGRRARACRRAPERRVLDLFGRLGQVITVDEKLMDVATGLMSCGPAYFALVVESVRGSRRPAGLTPEQAAEMVVAPWGARRSCCAREDGRRCRSAARSPRPAGDRRRPARARARRRARGLRRRPRRGLDGP